MEDAIGKAAEWFKDDDRPFHPDDYTWAFVPCPSCRDTHLFGVLDPDETLEVGETTFVVIPTEGD